MHSHDQLGHTPDKPPLTDSRVARTGALALSDLHGEQAAEPTSYSFMFVEHSPEMAPAIAEQLVSAGVQVLALEARGIKNAAEQQAFGKVYTALLSSEMDEPRRERIFSKLGQSEGDVFIRELLTQLHGTNMEVAVIDVAQDDPEYAGAVVEKQKRLEYKNAIATNETNDKLLARLDASYRAFAAENVGRENVMGRKLNALQERYAGKKIGPVIGSFHAPVANKITGSAETSSVFIDGYDEPSYEAPDQLLRYRTMREYCNDPEIVADKAVLNRILLSDIYYTFCANGLYGINDESTMYEEDETRRHIDEQVVGAMNDGQVTDFLNRLDGMKQGMFARRYPDRTRQKIYAALLETHRQLSA